MLVRHKGITAFYSMLKRGNSQEDATEKQFLNLKQDFPKAENMHSDSKPHVKD